MKLTLLFLTIGLLQVSASVYSQATKLTLNMRDAKVVDILDAIENQSEFRFAYSPGYIDLERKLSLEVKDKTLEQCLKVIFDKTDVEYAIRDRHILLFPGAMYQGSGTVIAYSQLRNIQQRTVSGKVTDSGGQPLPGVSIVIKGTTQGTVSDANGNYSLSNLPDGATLVFSFVGMKSQEIAVGNQVTINAVMLEDVLGIEEVVAIGYGTKKRVNLTGSVSSVKSEDLVKRPTYSVGSLIQGRAPGLQIIQQSGEPGNELLKIAIRGQGTFSTAGSNPLVVIDGVAQPSWTNLNNLDPDNIESIDVLKDAASASIYGARAANGVILVTTKKGITGKPVINYHGYTGYQLPTYLPDFVYNSAEYMEMYNYAAARQKTGTPFPQSLIDAYKNASPNDPQYPNFNWLDAAFQKGWGQKHSLSATGGNENTKFYGDVGYYSQNAVLKGQTYDRYTLQFNLDTKITDWMTFGTTLNGLVGNKLGPAVTINTLMMNVFDMNPTTSPRLPDGRWSVGSVQHPYYMTGNPVRLTATGGDGGSRLNEEHTVTATGYLNINITPDLLWNITGAYNYDANFSKLHQALPAEPEEYYFQSGAFARLMTIVHPGVQDSWSRSVMPTFHTTLNYEKIFADVHNFSALAGYDQEYYKGRNLSGHRRDFGFPFLTEINAGDVSVQTLSGTSSDWAIQSLFGRLGYDYKGKYLFEANARYDGTSRIHKNNRWGFFPSFSAAWRLSEEGFLNQDWMDNLKIRASWGQLGNQNIGNYPYQSTLSTTNYAQGTGVTQGVLLTALSDINLKWEVTTITNLGLDMDLGEGLFSLTFDVYNKDTEGILNRANIPASVGLTAPMINYGSMNNKGFELMIGHRNSINELSYYVDFNLSHNRNKITELVSPSYGLRSNQVGHEFGAHYMVEWIGVFQSQAEIDAAPVHPFAPQPGDLIFKDQNGDNKIDADDRIIISGRYPKFLYGGNINLDWKNLDLSLFIQGISGIKHFITRRGEWPFLRMAPPTKDWRNAWTPENPTNDMPALYIWPYNPVSGYNNSYFLKNTSYVRLKNIQLGYTLPNDLTGRFGLQDVRVYVSADNWFTYSPYTIHDPERNEDQYHSGGQTEAGAYPNVKTLSFGIRLNIN